jgi:hypothetical protein
VRQGREDIQRICRCRDDAMRVNVSAAGVAPQVQIPGPLVALFAAASAPQNVVAGERYLSIYQPCP